ncbi:MAG: disulfide bond formation protein B [Betaproteobacteria bacterium]|nr:disulfide bond formation protein B [Betaproteobacteria bacterium]
MRLPPLSFRLLAAAGALACASLLAYGYYLQYFEGQDPCPLCLLQRGSYYALIVVFAAAAMHDPGRKGRIAWGVAAFLAAASGVGVATRQVYLQHLPPDQVPACGPDLFFMMENLPVARTLQLLFRGSGQCAEVKWRFLGLSIAEWSLLWFLAFAALAVLLALKKGLRR